MKKNIFAAILLVSLNAWTQNNAPCKTESELKIYPVLWQQRAAEYRALCYQAFNIATLRLNAAVKNKGANKKTALITDLDETILDNSYQQGSCHCRSRGRCFFATRETERGKHFLYQQQGHQ